VPAAAVIPYQNAFDEPTALGPVAQIIHAAVEAGIARAAVAETIQFRERTRPWMDANVEHGYEGTVDQPDRRIGSPIAWRGGIVGACGSLR
jgi:alkylation response protein AidB-like acyl-CoA dehydrogenase